MAKTGTNTENTGAAAVKKETRAKAPSGSSLQAQAKSLVLILWTELVAGIAAYEGLKLTDLVQPDTAEWFEKVANELASVSVRGLPLNVQLTAVQKAIAEHYANAPIKDGVLDSTNTEWQAKSTELINERTKIEKAIAKEAEQAKAKENEETETAPVSEAATAGASKGKSK